MIWEGCVALTEKTRNVYKILVGKSEGKRTAPTTMSRQWCPFCRFHNQNSVSSSAIHACYMYRQSRLSHLKLY
jgi:hypothetical protein